MSETPQSKIRTRTGAETITAREKNIETLRGLGYIVSDSGAIAEPRTCFVIGFVVENSVVEIDFTLRHDSNMSAQYGVWRADLYALARSRGLQPKLVTSDDPLDVDHTAEMYSKTANRLLELSYELRRTIK